MNLLLCCNDYRNGLFQGHFGAAVIELPDGETIELHGPRVGLRECEGKRLKIGRMSVFTLGSSEWVGNWCWNGYALGTWELLRVANYLKIRGFTPEAAPTEIYDRWQLPGEISADEWGRWISRREVV